MPNPQGQLVNRSHSNGLGIKEMWCRLFRENEVQFRKGCLWLVLTDEQLSNFMIRSFPDNWQSGSLRMPIQQRSRYNQGVFTNGVKPRVKSRRYIRNVDNSVYAVTARGRVVERGNNER